jgi:hypothetical protein
MAGLYTSISSKSLKMIKNFIILNQQIWLGLGISIVCVIVILNLIQRYSESASGTGFRLNNKPQTGNLTNNGQLRGTKGETGKQQYLYVFGNLLSQGFHTFENYTRFIEGDTQVTLLIRMRLSIEKITLPTSRWRLDPGRFHFRPGLHVDSLHLRRKANQSSANQFSLRHC